MHQPPMLSNQWPHAVMTAPASSPAVVMMAASGTGAAFVLPPRFCVSSVMGRATASPANGIGVCSGMPPNMPPRPAGPAAAAPRLAVGGSAGK